VGGGRAGRGRGCGEKDREKGEKGRFLEEKNFQEGGRKEVGQVSRISRPCGCFGSHTRVVLQYLVAYHISFTEIPFLARRSKYHLSIWPLSRGELILRLDEIIYFLVSRFLLQVSSRSFTSLPPFLDFSHYVLRPSRGLFSSLSGFTTSAYLLKRCSQDVRVSNLSTNPFCGLLQSHRQDISRFPQIGFVFLTFKKIVRPTNTGGTGARIGASDDAESDEDDDDETSVLEFILGCQVGQREDTACDEDWVNVSVRVDVAAGVGVGVHGQCVKLGVSLGVGIVVGLPPITSLDSQGARLRFWSLMT